MLHTFNKILATYYALRPKLQYCSLEMRQDVSLFSLSNLGQIGIPMTVLESARPEDSKTPPISLI